MTAPKRDLKIKHRMNEAVDAVNNGYTYRDAAKKFRVPTSTLHDKVNKTAQKAGRRKALSDKDEDVIVSFLQRHADRGIPLTQTHLCEAVEIIAGKMSITRRLCLPFNRFRPGRAFLRAFRNRHADRIKFGKPLRQEHSRFLAVNAETLCTHFAVLEKLIEEHNLDADRIFNLDEAGMTPDRELHGNTVAKRLMSKKGSRDFRSVDFKNVHRVTMMPLISASGNTGPPFFVFKGHRLHYRKVRNGRSFVEETPVCLLPPGSTAALRLENGGVDSINFCNWAYSFLNYVRPLTAGGRKELLIYDGYRAHLSLHVLEIVHNNNIEVYALPAHTSGKTQPLDVVLFSVFKNALNSVLSNCTVSSGKCSLNIFYFCALLREAYALSFKTGNIRAGFRRSGIWPLDASRLLGVPRPANREKDSTVMSVEELEKAFEEKRIEYRTRVLGDDAFITESGYVDTTNGCVMTASRVLDMVREKQNRDRRKYELAQTKIAEKERRLEVSKVTAIRKGRQIRFERMQRCASLAGMPYESFILYVRPFAERRMLAKQLAAKPKASTTS